jgi:hypothetical protein
VGLRRTLHSVPLLLATALCAVAGCGLPDARPDLPPPIAGDASVTAEQFTLTVPSATEPPFLGVELYYRLTAVGSVRARDLETRADVLAQGFRRVASSTDRYPSPTLPLIAAPGAGVVVTLDFSEVDLGKDPAATFRDRNGTERRVSLRRAIDESDGRYKRFACDQFDDGDSDIGTVEEELTGADACESVQLQLYAVSYGGTESLTVYSDTVDLGTINLTFGQ